MQQQERLTGKGGAASTTLGDGTVTAAGMVPATRHHEDHGWVHMVADVCQEQGLLLVDSGADEHVCLLEFAAGFCQELADDDKSTAVDVHWGATATRRLTHVEVGADGTKSLFADHLSDLPRV